MVILFSKDNHSAANGGRGGQLRIEVGFKKARAL